MGFEAQLNEIVSRLPTAPQRQTLLFSATQTKSVRIRSTATTCKLASPKLSFLSARHHAASLGLLLTSSPHCSFPNISDLRMPGPGTGSSVPQRPRVPGCSRTGEACNAKETGTDVILGVHATSRALRSPHQACHFISSHSYRLIVAPFVTCRIIVVSLLYHFRVISLCCACVTVRLAFATLTSSLLLPPSLLCHHAAVTDAKLRHVRSG